MAGKPLTVLAAAEAGDTLAELQGMRVIVAAAVQSKDTPARDLAALTKRLKDIGCEIDELRRKRAEEAESGEVAPDEEWGGV